MFAKNDSTRVRLVAVTIDSPRHNLQKAVWDGKNIVLTPPTPKVNAREDPLAQLVDASAFLGDVGGSSPRTVVFLFFGTKKRRPSDSNPRLPAKRLKHLPTELKGLVLH